MRIITISREFGSGGRELGKRLAEELGFAYYDKEILSMISERMQMDEGYIEKELNKSITIAYPYTIRRSFYQTPSQVNQVSKLLAEQNKIIRSLAEKEDCIIVGRGADAILREYNPFSLFIYADQASKVARCRNRAPEEERLSENELKQKMKQIDKSRAAAYALVSEYSWGDKKAYQLCINTSGIMIPKMVSSLADFAKIWFERKNTNGNSIIGSL
ncbi:cytidylate kinase-like family protein [Faecalicatena acetigenes]|uniref:Cytidylate kinase-like family protein n=1 Tax=Faecalicatena acetigenes TaxID=2981790 RepID=A0ABT2TD24_9FIRM|nr:cytidylate kinase-like family protein [Faecalicatena acetigenes]MCU6747716.1 cytidylate kinase-like family protein [Faecalicatena acetigenes]SCI04780.1 cytidylate kinase [uncultured Clostridium sp.]